MKISGILSFVSRLRILPQLRAELRDMKSAVEALVPALERMREANERSLEAIFKHQTRKYEEVLEHHAKSLERMGQTNEKSLEAIFKLQAKKYEDMSDSSSRAVKVSFVMPVPILLYPMHNS